jgi:hypothetical protein
MSNYLLSFIAHSQKTSRMQARYSLADRPQLVLPGCRETDLLWEIMQAAGTHV